MLQPLRAALQIAVHKTSHCLPEGSLNGDCRRHKCIAKTKHKNFGKITKKGKEKSYWHDILPY